MRALVMGYHTMGCVGFDALLRNGFEIPAVFTHRDDPREEVWWESLAARAERHGIPVHTPQDIKDPRWGDAVRGYAPDFLFSFYFRFMIPGAILDIPPRGALNLHGSLLPKYRGRAPANWVLVNGERETGVSLHYMVAKPDAGDLVDQERVEIAFEDTARSLFAKLERAAAALLDRTLPLLAAGTASARPLDLSQGSYFGGRGPEDGRVEWEWPAVRIYNLIRAVTHPYPGAFTTLGGKRLYLWWGRPEPPGATPAADAQRLPQPGVVLSVGSEGVRVAAGEGDLLLLQCQSEGSPELEACAWAGANGVLPGTRLGS